MTTRTRFKADLCEDLSKRNDILLLDRSHIDCKVGGLSFISTEGSRLERQIQALMLIHSAMRTHWENLVVWLLLGHTAWQPINRVVYHKKMIGSLKDSGLSLPKGKIEPESLIERDGKAKFFTAIKCEQFDAAQLIAILQNERASTILFSHGLRIDGRVASLLKTGWTKQGYAPPPEMLIEICHGDLFVGFPIGEFDDREAGFGCVGPRADVKTLAQQLPDT